MAAAGLVALSCTLVPPPPGTCAPCPVCTPEVAEAVPLALPAPPPTALAPAAPVPAAPPPAAPPPTCGSTKNLALNPDRAGFPTPLQSDHGWGGGSDVWEVVDGRVAYDSWAHGLAFTGGHNGPSGGEPWGAPAGPRQATIDFGRALRFDRLVVWNHGDDHNPAEVELETLQDERWVPLPFSRARATAQSEGPGSATADTYSFEPVVARAIRYRFDNRGRNVLGTWNVHGWLYELEVFDCLAPAE